MFKETCEFSREVLTIELGLSALIGGGLFRLKLIGGVYHETLSDPKCSFGLPYFNATLFVGRSASHTGAFEGDANFLEPRR